MPANFNKFNFNQCNFNAALCLFDEVTEAVSIISKDLVKLNLVLDIVTIPSVYTLSNYSVVGIGVPNPTVIDIITASDREVSSILVVLSGTQAGGTYQLSIASGVFYTASGDSLPKQTIDFTLHRTKLDFVLTSVPRFYNTASKSNFRSILEAIMMSDEEIGGDF